MSGEEGFLERIDETIDYSERRLVRGRGIRFVAAHVRIVLLLYGAVFAAVGGVQLDHSIHAAGVGLNSERQGELFASMDVVDAHGPPLTGSSNGYYPVATDDDRGSFIYIPLAGHLFHTHDLDAILKWFFIVFFVPLLLAYPLVLYELTGSFVAAIAAPQILLAHSSFLRTSGIFWLPAWANLVLLPLLLLIAKRWDRSRLWLLVAGALIASLLSSMRANAGLGFLIGAVVLLFMRMPSWRMRCWSVGLVLLAYLSIGTFAMHAVQVQRDDVVGHDFTSPYPNGHPFWHNAYIGLGYLKNPYGLYPSDAAAMAAAQRHDPGATFPSIRYERALRAVYFDIVKRHPGFVLHEYALKAVVVLGRAVDWFRAAVVLVPLLLLFGKRRRARRSQVGLLLGAGLVAVITPIVTTPTEITETESGWYGLLLLLWLLAIGWLARPVEAVVVRVASRLVRRWLAAREQAALRRDALWPLKVRVLVMARNLGRRVVAGPARAARAAFRAGRRAWAVPRLGGVVRSVAAAAVVAALFIGSGSANRPTLRPRIGEIRAPLFRGPRSPGRRSSTGRSGEEFLPGGGRRRTASVRPARPCCYARRAASTATSSVRRRARSNPAVISFWSTDG